MSVFIAATPEEMARALPDWTPEKTALPKGRVTKAPGPGVVAGAGDYKKHLEGLLPRGLKSMPHAVLKNVVFQHLTAACWAMGAELLQAPQPFLYPPREAADASLHPLPAEAVRKLAKASDSKLESAAKKLARSSVCQDLGWDAHDALELLKQLKPVAEAAVAESREAFVFQLP
ncbi:hypothetical protein NVS55_10245 [Myxococcus stipitatus]|uniref:hypothetical protein n=1 Tax=Myxococcus stipitatus TaxID=83455 RepID=UPI0031452AE9